MDSNFWDYEQSWIPGEDIGKEIRRRCRTSNFLWLSTRSFCEFGYLDKDVNGNDIGLKTAQNCGDQVIEQILL